MNLRWLTPLVVVLLVSLNAVPITSAHAAADTDVTLTLTINKIQQHESPDNGSTGDYFPEIRIGDRAEDPVMRKPPVTDDVFDPSTFPDPWRFTHTTKVPQDRTTVPVLIRIWDDDDGTNFGGDRMDISPQDRDVELNLLFDIGTGTWTGVEDEIFPGQVEITGDQDEDFPEVNDGLKMTVGINIRLESKLPDLDGDGIHDVIERFGIRDKTGKMVYDLKAMGAHPCRKTIILTIDYMKSPAQDHKPKDKAIEELKAAFGAAPVNPVRPCPYDVADPAVGVDFLYIEGKQIAHRQEMHLDDYFREVREDNLNPLLRPYAHYAVFAHLLAGGALDDSGYCCESDKDFIVTLGNWRTLCIAPGTDGTLESKEAGDDTVIGNQIDVGTNGDCETQAATTDEQFLPKGTGKENARVGTVRDQSSTIMHELGHSLGLNHGGGDRTNNKPNYLSVMNYSFLPGGIPTGPGRDPVRRLDYSSEDLPDLHREQLDESRGIQDGTDHTHWKDPKGTLQTGPGRGPLNWNWNFDATSKPIIDPPTVNVDINADDDVCVLPGPNGKLESDVKSDDQAVDAVILDGNDNMCQSTPKAGTDDTGRDPILKGHDDWENLNFQAVGVKGSGGEIGFRQVVSQELAHRRFYSPDVAAAKTVDKETALPGDALTYQVKVDNVGPGRATAVTLSDTLPDGTVATRTLPDLAPAGSHTETFTHLVHCTTPDGTELTNRASVAAKNLAEEAEENTANNTGTATTKIKAPVVALAASTTPSADAAEAVTTTLKVTNTGSAAATGVTLTYTLPSGVYYSTALDQGQGPKPSTVTPTTLTWQLGSVEDTTSVNFTTRSSLLTPGGTVLTGQAKVSYGNANGCTYDPVNATTTSTVTEATPTRDPRIATIWATLTGLRTPELLARVQATDTRYDSSGDGRLSQDEASAAFSLPLLQPRTLKAELLATYLNLGSRRINAATAVHTITLERLGLRTVADAARHAQATLPLPPLANVVRYTDATLALVEINSGLAERY
ncbi:CARDB domain-containing protein [Nonomuraea sp. SYSU D8015]|uniref:CARDB domain-containing protein n=1 Tax=Nonomuraea sp. SYSU D8015 TaxID=2593644 RepID=UPI0016605A51|nr:CARDB domain-containing protein [Nonomuraea sp. SYSU D8015]